MMHVPISRTIADFAAALRYEDLPEALREFARYHILDAVGVAIAATEADFARCALAGLLPLAEGGNSSLIGLPDKLGLRDAVLMNGVLAHGLDYDDTHTGSQVHPTVNAFPCALGLAEFLDTGGRELLTAYVLGGELATRVGIAANGAMQAQGFHNTGVAGHLGCAVAAAKLYKLNADQTAHAQGLAGSMASGISEYRIDGSWNKRMHPGWAGVGGISAASLARGGYVGACEVYEGKYGLFKTHAAGGAEFDLGALTEGLGSEWRLQEAAIKPLPACHLLHACVDSALALKGEHNLKPDDIAEACALLHPTTFRMVCEPVELRKRPPSENIAQFSAQFVIAACFVRGRFSFAELTPEARADEHILALAQRVSYAEYPGSRFPQYLSGGVTIKTKDGRVFTHREDINRGNGERALTNADTVAKFMENAEQVLSHDRAGRIRDLVLNMDQLPVRELARGLSAQ
jgi:2-methylcitrate dehydratase PrpD